MKKLEMCIPILLLMLMTSVAFSQEKLEVGGAIIIQNSEDVTPAAGTIRWTGSDFEGWNGSHWISLSGGAIKDIDNNTYKVVTIGTQIWMAENLRVTHYNDGTAIPLAPDALSWTTASTNGTAAHTWYDNGDYGTPDYGAPEYGALYNWYAIDAMSNGNKNICPAGWHVPTDAEWTTLIPGINDYGPEGGEMKETGLGHWNSPNAGATNNSGFTALPGGWCSTAGSFSDLGNTGYWWSSTSQAHMSPNDPPTGYGFYVYIQHNWPFAWSGNNPKGMGYSVRCLKN